VYFSGKKEKKHGTSSQGYHFAIFTEKININMANDLIFFCVYYP
jgi:hypothetical protein